MLVTGTFSGNFHGSWLYSGGGHSARCQKNTVKPFLLKNVVSKVGGCFIQQGMFIIGMYLCL